eukprot:GILJ01001784.1.p1 GENE.GILJ01001784.1~~GILJ01001784.1.p1  ORF type:complete len:371 (+),score=69.92 GILJ01001784.1:53-1114(+)
MSAAQKEKKMKEAQDLYAKGVKAAKTSLTKWKADYDSASNYFENAARGFRGVGFDEQAIEAYEKAAFCYEKCDSMFSAGRALEAACTIASQMGQPFKEKATVMYRKAAHYFKAYGAADKAVEMFTKAAKLREDADPEGTIKMYEEAIETTIHDDRQIFVSDIFRPYVGFLVKTERYPAALKALKHQIDILKSIEGQRDNMHKAFLSQVIINLILNDSVGAENTIQDAMQIEGFTRTTEYTAGSDLIDAFNQGDAAELKKALDKPVFGFLDNNLSRLAKRISVPTLPSAPAGAAASLFKPKTAPSSVPSLAPRSVTPPPAGQEPAAGTYDDHQHEHEEEAKAEESTTDTYDFLA